MPDPHDDSTTTRRAVPLRVPTDQLDAARSFYRTALGFEAQEDDGTLVLPASGFRIRLLGEVASAAEPERRGVVAGFIVEDFEAWVDDLLRAGCRFAPTVRASPAAHRSAQVEDPYGHLWMLYRFHPDLHDDLKHDPR
jgi:catechol 2,3-dioxygenase-like lactoylglutathione lyase family enzyme